MTVRRYVVSVDELLGDEAIVRAGKQMALIHGYSLMNWPEHDAACMNEARAVIHAALGDREEWYG